MNFVKPLTETLIVEGPIYYHNRDRMFNFLRLKKKLMVFFGKVSHNEFLTYHAELHPTFASLREKINELERDGLLPLILLFEKHERKKE